MTSSEIVVKLATSQEHNQEAKDLIKSAGWGILSTHSLEYEGYPFGSVTPFALTSKNEPIILISNLAQHTKNIRQNAKVSLTITGGENENVQSNPRITYLGKAIEVSDEELDSISTQYVSKYPQAKNYFNAHNMGGGIDFRFYVIKLTIARYIGGFGKIFWLNYEALQD